MAVAPRPVGDVEAVTTGDVLGATAADGDKVGDPLGDDVGNMLASASAFGAQSPHSSGNSIRPICTGGVTDHTNEVLITLMRSSRRTLSHASF